MPSTRRPSEAAVTRKINSLKQMFKRLKREEKLYKLRNRKLANDIQSRKEWIKELDDEKIDLQKELFDQQYDRAICNEDSVTLSNELSSVLKEVHNLQAKIMDSWVEHLVNNGSQKLSRTNASAELVAVPKDVVTPASDAVLISPCNSLNQFNDLDGGTPAVDMVLSLSPRRSLNRSKDTELVCYAETMSTNQPELVVPNVESVSSTESEPGARGESNLPPETKAETMSTNQPELVVPNVEGVSCTESEPGAHGESSIPPKTKELVCYAETMSTNQPELVVPNVEGVSCTESEPGAHGESSIPPKTKELVCYAETMSTKQPELVVPNVEGVSCTESEPGAHGVSSLPPKTKAETMSTKQPELVVPNVESVSSTESEPGAHGESSIPPKNKGLSGSSTSFYRRETVLLERNSFPEHNQQTENDDSSSDEAFIGFVEDPIVKAKFTELIERLSLTCASLGSLRDDKSLSLTVCERRPEAENTSSSVLESEWSKQFNLQPLEVSLPKLDLVPFQTMCSSTMSLIWKQQDKEAEKRTSNWCERVNSKVSPGSSTKRTSSQEMNNELIEKKKLSTEKRRDSSAMTTPKTPLACKRDDLPGSGSDSLSNGRVPRRARNAVVSYKEKPLHVKLRR